MDPTAHGSIPECFISDTSGIARINIGHPCITSSPLKIVTYNKHHIKIINRINA